MASWVDLTVMEPSRIRVRHGNVDALAPIPHQAQTTAACQIDQQVPNQSCPNPAASRRLGGSLTPGKGFCG
jgi:hypothetical protein